ncbi:lipoyl synthase, partial [Candidatus Omnitrophota bacterium]
MKNKRIEPTKKRKVLARPKWIRGRVSWDKSFGEVRDVLNGLNLNSVCVEAACPNRGECWQMRHVTFMIMGQICTRGCRFCDVTGGSPEALDASEPRKVAAAVEKLAVKYAVITSVTRDDLQDKGAGHFIRTVREIKTNTPQVLVESLIPDFTGDAGLLKRIAFSQAEVIAHNIEVPRKLYSKVRPKADYRRSLDVLKTLGVAKTEGAKILTKSSIILGLGETEDDIFRTLKDLRDAGVDIVYIGQYLSPSREHWPVTRYYSPDEFKFFEEEAVRMGFGAVCAGPMVRSS